MALKTSERSSDIGARLERIEGKLFGNGESLLERVTRLEAGQNTILARLDEYQRSREEDIEKALLKAQERRNDLLEQQVTSQKRQSLIQFIGLWVSVVGLFLLWWFK